MTSQPNASGRKQTPQCEVNTLVSKKRHSSSGIIFFSTQPSHPVEAFDRSNLSVLAVIKNNLKFRMKPKNTNIALKSFLCS